MKALSLHQPVDRPIIFSGPMIRALLDGRKTMTRRLAWTPYDRPDSGDLSCRVIDGRRYRASPWQRTKPGDRLWVRESLKAINIDLGGTLGLTEPLKAFDPSRKDIAAAYSADGEPCVNEDEFNLAWIWERYSLPSIHMPRAFSRITLEVTAVKVEPLQDISENAAQAEGLERGDCGRAGCWKNYIGSGCLTPGDSFASLWNSLHGADAWEANTEVVALTFTVHLRNIDQMAKAA